MGSNILYDAMVGTIKWISKLDSLSELLQQTTGSQLVETSQYISSLTWSELNRIMNKQLIMVINSHDELESGTIIISFYYKSLEVFKIYNLTTMKFGTAIHQSCLSDAHNLSPGRP